MSYFISNIWLWFRKRLSRHGSYCLCKATVFLVAACSRNAFSIFCLILGYEIVDTKMFMSPLENYICIRDHSFITDAKVFEKITFLTPLYTHVRLRIRGWEMLVFPENFMYVPNEWPLWKKLISIKFLGGIFRTLSSIFDGDLMEPYPQNSSIAYTW